jgi:hypothetical protein
VARPSMSGTEACLAEQHDNAVDLPGGESLTLKPSVAHEPGLVWFCVGEWDFVVYLARPASPCLLPAHNPCLDPCTALCTSVCLLNLQPEPSAGVASEQFLGVGPLCVL